MRHHIGGSSFAEQRLHTQRESGRSGTIRLGLRVEASSPMQILVPYEGPPEGYQATSAERKMPRPATCPNCGSGRRLRFHGYYARFVSGQSDGEAMLVNIRRYRCRDCRLTTSLLPWFCLPYRLVRGEAVSRYLRGDGIDACDLRWQGLLSRCQARFESWLPQIVAPLESLFGLCLKGLSASGGWRAVEAKFGSIGRATGSLISACRQTYLGRYSCHQPGLPLAGWEDDHTHLLFSSGTDPPS